jgi:hypothetical protein
MDIRVLELIERGVKALESIATSLSTHQSPTQDNPAVDESHLSRHLILCADVRCQIQRLGYGKDDYAQAKKLLANTFEGETSLKKLSIAQLTEYAKSLRLLEGLKNDN